MENQFDLYDLPQGHEARFQAKLERQQRRRKTVRRFLGCSAAAAVLAAGLWISSLHPFIGARSPEAVYTAYLEEVGDLYRLFAAHVDDDSVDWETLLRDLTEETVPMYDQLPEDLSDRSKARILRQYYGDILEGADQLRIEMKQQNHRL